VTTATPEISVAVERKPGSLVELKVEAPAEELDRALQAAVRRLGNRVRIPGFRPGKAPVAVVERAIGWDALRREAVDELVPALYLRALEQAAIEPIGEPHVHVDTVERGSPVTFTAEVTVAPQVDLGDYGSLRVERKTTTVTDDQVEEALMEVRRRHSELTPVDRPAQGGDVVRSVLVMRRGDETLSNAEGAERDLELDRDRLIPGLVDGIVGLEPGSQRTFPLTLPEDYAQEELRGVTVEVDVRVVDIRERALPELDDELARKDEHGETVDELRAFYRERLEDAAEHEDQDTFENEVLTALRDRVKVDVPEAMVDREIDRQISDMEMRLSGLGMGLERYLEYTGSDMAAFRRERREAAVARVRLELALDALAAAEGIEIDESQVEREVERIVEGRKVTADQRRRLRRISRNDLTRRAAAERALEIAAGG
jgi:trigger factor